MYYIYPTITSKIINTLLYNDITMGIDEDSHCLMITNSGLEIIKHFY